MPSSTTPTTARAAPDRAAPPELDARRKRLKFRAWHRGMREVDLIMGRFADREIATLSDHDLDLFEALLEEVDDAVYTWVTGRVATPAEFETPLFRRICAFRHA